MAYESIGSIESETGRLIKLGWDVERECMIAIPAPGVMEYPTERRQCTYAEAVEDAKAMYGADTWGLRLRR